MAQKGASTLDEILKIMVTAECIKNEDVLTNKIIPELEIGKIYEVEDISMGQSNTRIRLKGINGIFNSIYFKFYYNDEPINIYEDKRFNPYI